MLPDEFAESRPVLRKQILIGIQHKNPRACRRDERLVARAAEIIFPSGLD
jgi:hypothetical protein